MDALRALATASPVADHLASTGGGMSPLVAASRSRSTSNGLGSCAPRGAAHGPAGTLPCQTVPRVATVAPRPSPVHVDAGLWHSKLGRAGFAAASFTSSASMTSSPGCVALSTQKPSAWSIDTLAGSAQPKSEPPTEQQSVFAPPSVATSFGSVTSAAFSSGLRQFRDLRDANTDAGDDAHGPVSAARYGYFTGLCGLTGCAAPAGNKAAAADGWGMSSGSGGSGLFSPNSETAWMNLSVATPGPAAATVVAAPRPNTANTAGLQSSGRFECLQMWPESEHRSKEASQDDDEDPVTPTPAMCTNDAGATEDRYSYYTSPTDLATPTPDHPMTHQFCGPTAPTARQPSRVWHSSKASPQHGPRVLLKPPPIHRSKLYQRRRQNRANRAAKLKLAGGAISQPGPEAKLAAFEQKLGRLKPVASC